ncbi:hypothetical protein ACFPN2_04135, partial [Steroidobacter flavus]
KATQSVLEHQGNRPLPKKRLSPPESRGFTPPLTPADVGRALAAVQRAREILEASGRRYLLACAKGVETRDLEQAVSVYSKFCSRAGLQSHAARYAFAEERMQAYRNEGLSQREARIATSLDLGHGDGRGRYVASVYVRNG